ncbi:MAG TPA: alpha-amylase family glycosyl hydrolase [Candidatus Angelobacter sp.]|nr:alpha-amylase family glycosyl hydrolase [Candidatus Angelobacter sp.]
MGGHVDSWLRMLDKKIETVSGLRKSGITCLLIPSTLVDRLYSGSLICRSLLLVLALCISSAAQPPRIDKIEPPNWWIGLPDPMIMFTGENFDGAQPSVSGDGVHIRRTMSGRNGHYFFLWLAIDKQAKPAKISLALSTSKGKAAAEWNLERRSPAELKEGYNGFGPDDAIYLIMPDRFADGDPANNFPASGTYDRAAPRAYHGGDLMGIQQHLPYLKELGITVLWITPIYDNGDLSGDDYHGYGAVDLYAVEEHLGTLETYRSLVNAAHQLGIKVVLDIVPNHIGPTNPWAADPPTNRWLHGTRQDHLIANADFEHLVDPRASLLERRKIVEGWFAGVLPDMGTDDPIASQFLRQNALWWAETGAVDGFRLDTLPYVDRQFWHDFHFQLHRLYPRIKTVGEVSSFDPAIAAYFTGHKTAAGIDTGVDTVFDFPLYAALRKVILHEAPATMLEQVLQEDRLFPHPDWLVTFLGNHDTPRFMGEADATPEKLRLAFAFLLTVRGVPQIYYGDEIGMAGGGDPDNRRDFPGGFPGDERNAFTAEGRRPDEQKVFTYVRSLLSLRRGHPALRRGKYIHIFSDERTFAYIRDSESERLLMVMNTASEPRVVDLPIGGTLLAKAKEITTILAEHDARVSPGAMVTIELPALSMSVYQVK